MKDLIEMLELKEQVDNLIENEIGNLTVNEFNELQEAGILNEALVHSLTKSVKKFGKNLMGRELEIARLKRAEKSANRYYQRVLDDIKKFKRTGGFGAEAPDYYKKMDQLRNLKSKASGRLRALQQKRQRAQDGVILARTGAGAAVGAAYGVKKLKEEKPKDKLGTK